MRVSGTLAARALSVGTWVAGRVLHVVLLAVYRRDPKALVILAAVAAALIVALELVL